MGDKLPVDGFGVSCCQSIFCDD